METNVYVLDPSYINRYVMASKPSYDANVITTEPNIGEYVELVQVDGTRVVTLDQTDICYSDEKVMYIPWCENGRIVLKPLNHTNDYEGATDPANVSSARLVEISSDTLNNVFANNSELSPLVMDVDVKNPVVSFNNRNNKVDLLPTIHDKSDTLYPDTALLNKACIENTALSPCHTEVIPHSEYVHNAYRIHKNNSVDASTKCAQQRFMLYKRYKSKLKTGSQKQTSSKMIPPKEFKSQLMDTSDIVTPLTLSPHTKKLVAISESNYDKSLFNPIHCIPRCAQNIFSRNCITRQENNDIDVKELELQPLGFTRVIDYSKIKRITRKRKNPRPFDTANTNENDATTTVVPNSNIQLSTHTGLIDNNLEVLLSGNDEESTFLYEGETTGKEQIIVIHDGRETAESTAYTQQNIEVLLAAAAEENSVSFCHPQGQGVSTETDNESFISKMNSQIIIVDNFYH